MSLPINHSHYEKLQNNLPEELHNIKQYITTKGKIPCLLTAQGAENKRWKRPDQWATLEGAVLMAKDHGFGIGMVLTQEIKSTKPGYTLCIIDLDNCRHNPKAEEIIDYLDTYTEISMSGNGYHCIVWAEGESSQYCGKRILNGSVKGDIRFYDNYTVLTGKLYGEAEGVATLTKTELETLFDIDLSRDLPGQSDLDPNDVKSMTWDTIENEEDWRWRQVLDLAEFDLDLQHLLHNRIKRQNKLVTLVGDESGSGVGFRLLLKVWDIFNDAKDLMALYEFAYRKATGGSVPTPSSVRASVYKVLSTGMRSLGQSEKVKGLIEAGEMEFNKDSFGDSGGSEPKTPQEARRLFEQMIGATQRIDKFYRDNLSRKTILVIGGDTYVYGENIFYPATFKSKVAAYLGVFHITTARAQMAMPLFMKCIDQEEEFYNACYQTVRYACSLVESASYNALHRFMAGNKMMRRDIELYEIDMPTLERDKETGRMKLIVPKSVLMDFFVKANINYGDKIINRLLTLTIADFVVKNTEKRGIVNLIELPYPVDYSSLFENLLNTDA